MRWAVYLASLVIAVVALVFILRPEFINAWFGFGGENHARACLRATGSTTEFTPGLSPSGDSMSAHFGGKEVIVGAANADTLKLVMDCLRDAYDRAGIEDDYITTEPVQLGLVADQWTGGEVGMTLLEPADTDLRDRLMNLAFGPAAGLRDEIMADWCETNAACVECAQGGAAWTVKAREGAVFEKLFLGTAPLSGDRQKPFQLVEADPANPEGPGRRVIFVCSDPS